MAITDRKMIALYIALAVLLWATLAGGSRGKPSPVLVFTLIIGPLALIWFSEFLGQGGSLGEVGHRPSPPLLVELFGWIFLCVASVGMILLPF